MYQRIFRTTVEGAAKLNRWVNEVQIIPEVRAPKFGEWAIGLKEITSGISQPTIVILDIGRTALPESIQDEIIALAEKDEAIIFAEINPRFHRESELIGLFCRQIGDSSLEKMKGQIPGLREALASF